MLLRVPDEIWLYVGKPIVLFQAMLKHAAETYPGALAGFKLSVVESHQKGKADTSGTAKAVVASMAELNSSDFGVVRCCVLYVCDRAHHTWTAQDDIEMIREPPEQLQRMGVPEEWIPGHAFHTYRLTSPDETVALEFQHVRLACAFVALVVLMRLLRRMSVAALSTPKARWTPSSFCPSKLMLTTPKRSGLC